MRESGEVWGKGSWGGENLAFLEPPVFPQVPMHHEGVRREGGGGVSGETLRARQGALLHGFMMHVSEEERKVGEGRLIEGEG